MGRIKISATAEKQLQAGYHFYERQSEGLGDYFLDSLMADVDSLHIHAGVHALYFNRYHRLLAKRFPHSLLAHWRRTYQQQITINLRYFASRFWDVARHQLYDGTTSS